MQKSADLQLVENFQKIKTKKKTFQITKKRNPFKLQKKVRIIFQFVKRQTEKKTFESLDFKYSAKN